jgi:hypothetical protein
MTFCLNFYVIWPSNCFLNNVQITDYYFKIQGKMSEKLAKPKAILDGSFLIAVYFIFWIVVTVVLPILSIGLRLYSKESDTMHDHTPETGT